MTLRARFREFQEDKTARAPGDALAAATFLATTGVASAQVKLGTEKAAVGSVCQAVLGLLNVCAGNAQAPAIELLPKK